MSLQKSCNARYPAAAIIHDAPRKVGANMPISAGDVSSWRQEFVRYLAASLVALAVDTVVLLTLAAIAHYMVAASVGFILGAVVSYLLATRWAFSRRRMAENSKSEFGIYLLVGLFGLGINNLVIFVAFGNLGIALIWAKAIAAAMTFAFNFIVRKLVLF